MEVVVPTLRLARNARLKSESKDEACNTPAVLKHESQEPPQIKSEEEDIKMYFHLQVLIYLVVMARSFMVCVFRILQDTIKVEVKAEETVSEDVVRGRLALIGYETFDLKGPRDILDATTTREFTTRVWGGNMQATFPKIGKEFTHGLDDFMYITLLYDPHAPRWPGSPGLLFRFKDDGEEWPKIMRVIVRLRSNPWQYMGQYKLTPAPSLSPNEWNAQSLKVDHGVRVRDDRKILTMKHECSDQAEVGEQTFQKEIRRWP